PPMATHQVHHGGALHVDPKVASPGSAPGAFFAANGTATETRSPTAPSSSYKRASRKGAPKKFPCQQEGCDKTYSRYEHLQRHKLNHSPKEIYRCDVLDCDQKFVRADLLARHKKRHSSSYIPRNRAPSFSTASSQTTAAGSGGGGGGSHGGSSHNGSNMPQPSGGSAYGSNGVSRPHYPASSGPHDAAILLTPDHSIVPPPASISNPQPPPPQQHPPRMASAPTWPQTQPLDTVDVDMLRPKASNYYPRETHAVPQPTSMLPFDGVDFQTDGQLSENFAAWLFDSQAGYNEFSAVANIPFLEGGLESTFNNNIHYDYESLTSRSQLDPTPPRLADMGDEQLNEHRRLEVVHWFQVFRSKQPKYESAIAGLVRDNSGDLPALNVDMMRHCLHEYWTHVSPRLPIVHQPTFSSNRCPVYLLMVMLALGAASLRARDTTRSFTDYGGFADIIISSIRWEIVTAEEASPPVGLWVAQALLLLEFYEKMYSSRRLHERAHIYHSTTLTLLRRGSPLIGRAGSESPPEEQVPLNDTSHGASLDSRMWWVRWAETESMHRVVFGAFMMDTVHAVMFGHLADMAPHEIRLPLPCDDALWTAQTTDAFRSVDGTHRMYGIKQISFLDGLKSALHCNAVKTHSFGRMIIMSGLLSVGWHLSHRESHLKWLDRGTPKSENDNWRRTLLRSFDVWKQSFDDDIGVSDPLESYCNGPIHTASVLYHLAHISLHVDITNCQVYAGVKRLRSRKVSTRDYANAVSRMKIWAGLAETRHAILHAFKLLYHVLVAGQSHSRKNGYPSIQDAYYSCRNEPDPHRPWVLYYAALSIYSFVRALGGPSSRPLRGQYVSTVDYLTRVASLRELDESAAHNLGDGLPELLRMLQSSLEESHWEILHEASERLSICREILLGGSS
ncbi:fungal-specific transcription factor domain-containing protein, partial [Plectosphaerella plurivora]